MEELFLSKIREESVQARTQMYDILSLLRRRCVTSGFITFSSGRCDVMFYDSEPDIYEHMKDKYDAEGLGTVYYIDGLNIAVMDFVKTKHWYTFRFTDEGVSTFRVDRVWYSESFDISELLYELKFEGMK